MVKKLEKGSTEAYSSPQQHLKISESPDEGKIELDGVKSSNNSRMGQNAFSCPHQAQK
jgi:hypothetical protein